MTNLAQITLDALLTGETEALATLLRSEPPQTLVHAFENAQGIADTGSTLMLLSLALELRAQCGLWNNFDDAARRVVSAARSSTINPFDIEAVNVSAGVMRLRWLERIS